MPPPLPPPPSPRILCFRAGSTARVVRPRETALARASRRRPARRLTAALAAVFGFIAVLATAPRRAAAQDGGVRPRPPIGAVQQSAALDAGSADASAPLATSADAGAALAATSPDAAGGEPAAQPPAPAEEDALTLRDGSLLRGRVTALEVGRQVVIVVTGGAARSVPWRDITSAEGPTFRSASVQLPTAPPPPPPRPPYSLASTDLTRPAPGQVPLRIESEGAPQQVGVTLAIEESGTGFESALLVRRRVLCTTPCTLYVRPGPFRLFATGHNLVETTSSVDVLPLGTRVRLYAASRGVRNAAIGFTTAALIGALGSLVTLLVVGASVSPLTLGIIAGATLGTSALLAIPGIILFATNPTGVRSTEPLAPPRAARALMVPLVAF